MTFIGVLTICKLVGVVECSKSWVAGLVNPSGMWRWELSIEIFAVQKE